jgi:hypothetical protein
LPVLIAILAVMAFPLAAFPHPGTNDAIGLADAEWPLLIAEVAAVVVVYFTFRGAGGAIVRSSIGVFLFGAAVALVVGLLVFGNLSDDRFAPLLFFPPVLGLLGLVGIVVAIAAHHRERRQLRLGVVNGLTLAVFFGAWLLIRGSRAWLLAPYGFDYLLLLGVLVAGLIVLGTSPAVGRSRPRG